MATAMATPYRAKARPEILATPVCYQPVDAWWCDAKPHIKRYVNNALSLNRNKQTRSTTWSLDLFSFHWSWRHRVAIREESAAHIAQADEQVVKVTLHAPVERVSTHHLEGICIKYFTRYDYGRLFFTVSKKLSLQKNWAWKKLRPISRKKLSPPEGIEEIKGEKLIF